MKILLVITLLWPFINQTTQTLIIADNTMTKMVELQAQKPYCIMHYDRGIIQRKIFGSDTLRLRRMSNESIASLEKICTPDQVQSNYQGGFIYPGTKWCGPGNIADNYEDLGKHKVEDKCCREHDSCPNALAKGECRQGICNDSPFTRSHCDCDGELRRCLQNINTETANTIGAIFFNVIQVTCFKERRPCTQWQSCDIEFEKSGRYEPSIIPRQNKTFFGKIRKLMLHKLYKFAKKFPNGYAQAEQDILCAQIVYSPSDKYFPLMPLPNK